VSRPTHPDLAGLLELLAHDLRSPLSALLTNINFLAGSLAGRAPDVGEALSDSAISCSILAQFIANLDVLSRLLVDPPPVIREVVLQRVASEAVARFEPQAKAFGLKLCITHGSSSPTVMADPRWLDRALDNVLANSLQYASAGSTVDVELAVRTDRGWLIVIDDGPVVPPDLRAWAPSAEAQSRGTQRVESRYGRGLGLYCAAEAARLAGADMALAEREGRAAFELSAPLPAGSTLLRS
jgi:signal transduction histidine kinase